MSETRKRTRQVGVRLTPTELDRLTILAESEGLSMATLLRRMTLDGEQVKADVWDECLRAVAWAMANGWSETFVSHVSKRNPYRADAQEQP